ncbi:hypothetical protein R1flu_026643 [Riccia fluitans]|uniref:CW-type domain-containing protein n=1 Tax=Riccia fluitans TaxID=41844 RepID=A0ABD1XGL2_9MARC
MSSGTSSFSRICMAPHTITNHAVQCARCGKYRHIPDKWHYEVIREYIHQLPWFCEKAVSWNKMASCDLPDEFAENSDFILAIDRPGIPATPLGWERIVHIAAGPTRRRFCNVYYITPPAFWTHHDRRMRCLQDIEMTLKICPNLIPPRLDIRTRFSFARPAAPWRDECEAPNASRGSGKSSDGFRSRSQGSSPKSRDLV